MLAFWRRARNSKSGVGRDSISPRESVSLYLLIFLTTMALAACARASTPLFIPPTAAAPDTLAATRMATSLPAGGEPALPAESPRSTAAPPCSSNLTFLEDLTIPDGALVAPASPLDKRWRVENSGSCNWDETYRLKLIAGPDLGAPPEQALYPARSGTQAVIRILFTAPAEAGSYRSAWQAYDSAGNAFGDLFFIEIVVEQSATDG